MAQLEIACFNVESAIIAQQNGADRIELCDGIKVGGITPSYQTVKEVNEFLAIDMYVMIRPRGGNFVYTIDEIETMKESILENKKLGVGGFVFGILNKDNKVDVTQNKTLVNLANPLPCTFHRAFDEVSNPFESLEEIIACGFKTILTSGQAPNVNEGLNRLTELVERADNRIAIMPGGSLRSSNIAVVQQQTNASWFHSSAITDGTETATGDEVVALKSKLR